MRIAITGGAGFLGTRLARAMLDRQSLSLAGGLESEIVAIRVLDRVAPPDDLAADSRVDAVVGDLSAQLADDPLRDVDLVVHLAAAVSGEAEEDFDLGMADNLDASRAVLEACRQQPEPPMLVFASSVAVFGAVPGYPLPEVISDATLPIPRSSYGMQKFVTEQVVSDYTRRGFVRGRSVRLMTVAVRSGRPNAAASSFVSGIIREPLNGERAACPVPDTTEIAVSSPRMAIDGLLAAVTAPDDLWGSSIAVNLPALTVTPREMAASMDRVAERSASALIDWTVDPAVVAVVATWPSRFRTDRANALGLTPEPGFDTIVRAHIDDLPAGVVEVDGG